MAVTTSSLFDPPINLLKSVLFRDAMVPRSVLHEPVPGSPAQAVASRGTADTERFEDLLCQHRDRFVAICSVLAGLHRRDRFVFGIEPVAGNGPAVSRGTGDNGVARVVAIGAFL